MKADVRIKNNYETKNLAEHHEFLIGMFESLESKIVE